VVTKYIFNSIELKSIEIATILSVTFCPYHFVRSPFHQFQLPFTQRMYFIKY